MQVIGDLISDAITRPPWSIGDTPAGRLPPVEHRGTSTDFFKHRATNTPYDRYVLDDSAVDEDLSNIEDRRSDDMQDDADRTWPRQQLYIE